MTIPFQYRRLIAPQARLLGCSNRVLKRCIINVSKATGLALTDPKSFDLILTAIKVTMKQGMK